MKLNMKLNNKILKVLKEAKEIKVPRNWELNDDGTYSVWNRSIENYDLEPFVKNGKLTVKFDYVRYDFDCSDLGLTTLEGCPNHCGGFNCSHNKLTNLEGAPELITGPGNGNFDCSYNKLTSLKGCTKKIGRFFNCSDNKLTSLKDGPIYVGDWLDCSNNAKVFTMEDISVIDRAKK